MIRSLAFPIRAVFTAGAVHLAIAAQPRDAMAQGGGESLQQQFDQAVAAQGDAYFTLRSNIVSRGTAALAFLDGQATNTNMHARVIARALTSRIKEPELNLKRSAMLAAIFSKRGVMTHGRQDTLDPLEEVLRLAGARPVGWSGSMMGSRPTPTSFAPPQKDDLHEEEAVPFLLEIVLKGLPETQRPASADAVLIRCFAAALVGWYTGADVIPVLAEQVKSGPHEMQVSAREGFRHARSYSAVAPLLVALSYDSTEIRLLAYHLLMDITGQDFRNVKSQSLQASGVDDEVRKQFEDWWRQNKNRLLAAMPTVTRDYTAVEPLLSALSRDNSTEIRVIAYGALMDMTGQDFRKVKSPNLQASDVDDDVRKQFEDWWQQNKERLLAAPPQHQERK